MKKKDIIDYIVTVVISGVIGACVALSISFFVDIESTLLRYLILSGTAGCSIGFCAKILFGVVFTRINSHPLFTFLSVTIVIAGGTFLWSLIINTKISSMNFIAMGAAVVVGMIATTLFWSLSHRLNLRLKEKQDQISTRKDST